MDSSSMVFVMNAAVHNIEHTNSILGLKTLKKIGSQHEETVF